MEGFLGELQTRNCMPYRPISGRRFGLGKNLYTCSCVSSVVMLDVVSSTLDTVTSYILIRMDSVVVSKSKLGIACLLIEGKSRL